MQAKEAYVAFLEHQNGLHKSEQVTQKVEDVAKKWCWKNRVKLVQFVVIDVLWYNRTRSRELYVRGCRTMDQILDVVAI
jgi:hypothetical protein